MKKQKKIAVVTCASLPAIAHDDMALVRALDDLGIACEAAPWNDPAMSWQDFDGIVVRSAWDYHMHHSQFRDWLSLLEAHAVASFNPVATMRWNSDKRYLLELEGHGAPIIPTRFVRGEQLARALADMAGEVVVVKPSVSGNSWHTVRGRAGDLAFARTVAGLPRELDYLVQRYLPEIETHGEWSLMYFDGRFSHAVRKLPAPGDYRVQTDFGGVATPAVPDESLQAQAAAGLQAVARAGHGGHCYARVDGVVVDGRFSIMEVELIEPALHLRADPDAPSRLAHTIAERLALAG